MMLLVRHFLGCFALPGAPPEGTMTPAVMRRSTYALLLIGALASCSAPPPQPPPPPSGSVATTDGSAVEHSTALGSIGPQGTKQPSGPGPASPSPASGAAQTAGNGAATTASSAQEAAARARVKAAREQAAKSQAQAAQQAADQCRDLASDIRAEQATERAAPSTSINEDIVNAKLAKADKRIERLQQQYDSLGCSGSDRPTTHERVPQLPPAPGALTP